MLNIKKKHLFSSIWHLIINLKSTQKAHTNLFFFPSKIEIKRCYDFFSLSLSLTRASKFLIFQTYFVALTRPSIFLRRRYCPCTQRPTQDEARLSLSLPNYTCDGVALFAFWPFLCILDFFHSWPGFVCIFVYLQIVCIVVWFCLFASKLFA